MSVPHPTWHRRYTDSHEYGHGPSMDRETVDLYILVRPLEFNQPRLGNWHWILQAAIGFRHIVYASHVKILYANINHRNKTVQQFECQTEEACFIVILAIQDTRLFHILTSFVYVCPLDMPRTQCGTMPPRICSPPVPCHGPWTVNASRFCSVSSPNVVSGVSGRKYSSNRQSDIVLHKRIHIYGQSNFYLMIFAFDVRRNLDLFCIFFTLARKHARIRIWRKNFVNSKQRDFILGDRK